jgi:DNA-binding PadR family transcriptional regulator
MPATETRLLILGAVAVFEPVNGYQIRRELISWRVEDWAHINPGSIYSSLATMTKHGLLERHDLVDGGRPVAVYTVTDAGHEELSTLFRTAIEDTAESIDRLAFHTALSLASLVPREDFVKWLTVRLDRLDERLAAMSRDLRASRRGNDTPPHILRLVSLWVESGRVERRWIRDLLDAVQAGELTFSGEPMTWQPSPDDPGHQMTADRERYLGLLGGG